jgi:hypothetical protein
VNVCSTSDLAKLTEVTSSLNDTTLPATQTEAAWLWEQPAVCRPNRPKVNRSMYEGQSKNRPTRRRKDRPIGGCLELWSGIIRRLSNTHHVLESNDLQARIDTLRRVTTSRSKSPKCPLNKVTLRQTLDSAWWGVFDYPQPYGLSHLALRELLADK